MGNEQSNEGKKSSTRSFASESDADAESCSVSASTSVKTPTSARQKGIGGGGSSALSVANSAADDTVGAALGLTPYQAQMLMQSWPRVQQTGGHQVGGQLFRKLATKSPPCREAFQKLTILEGFSPRGARSVDVYKEHGRLLFELFNEAIKALNEPASTIIMSCREYGGKHSGMFTSSGAGASSTFSTLNTDGFGSSSTSNRMWDDLSEIIVEHITKMDAVRKHRELCKAWTALITFLMEKCKDGCRHAALARKTSSHPSGSALTSGQQQQSETDSDVPTTSDKDVEDEEDDKTISLSA